MLSILLGLAFAVAGLCGLWTWRAEFVELVKGLAPISMIFAGVIAVIAGVSGRKSNG